MVRRPVMGEINEGNQVVSGWGMVPNEDKEKAKKAGMALVGIFGGLLLAAIGFGIGSIILGLVGVIGVISGVATVYMDIKKKQAAKQVAKEQAEIRAHQLRVARGEVAPPQTG